MEEARRRVKKQKLRKSLPPLETKSTSLLSRNNLPIKRYYNIGVVQFFAVIGISKSNPLCCASCSPFPLLSIPYFLQAKREENRNGNSMGITSAPPPRDAIEHACTMKEELLQDIEDLADRLPPNTLDQLIDELGGPENVAEVNCLSKTSTLN